jgi:hypothetical protein
MLTIENIHKLFKQPIWDGWEVNDIYEGTHNDTYIFELHRESAWGNGDCTIMLERTGKTHIFHSDKLVYFFIYNSQRTDVCATADWLADKDNMIAKLEYILVNKENL